MLRRTISTLALTLLLGACGGDAETSSTAPASDPEPVAQADSSDEASASADSRLDLRALAAVADAVQAASDDAGVAEALAAAGVTQESFRSALYDIAADPALTSEFLGYRAQ